MTTATEIGAIIDRFVSGQIPLGELLSHIEPALRRASNERLWQRRVDAIANDIEFAIYTLNDPERRDAIVEILNQAVRVLPS